MSIWPRLGPAPQEHPVLRANFRPGPGLVGEVLEVMKQLARESMTMVATHGMDFAKEVADRVISIDQGKVQVDTDPDNPRLKIS